MSQNNDTEPNLRRSSRIATTNPSTPTQSSTAGPVTRRRSSSASQDATFVPAKLTRAKRLSLSQETSVERPASPKTRSRRSESKSPTFEKDAKKVSTPLRGRRRASIRIIDEEEEEDKVFSPAPVTNKRRSSRGLSTSPSMDKQPETKIGALRRTVVLEAIEETDPVEKNVKKTNIKTRRNSNSSDMSDLSETSKKLVVDVVRFDTKRMTRTSMRASSSSPIKEDDEVVAKKKKIPELNPIAERSIVEDENNEKGDIENWERDSTKRLSKSPIKKEDALRHNSPRTASPIENARINKLSLKRIGSPKIATENDVPKSASSLENVGKLKDDDLKTKKLNSPSTPSDKKRDEHKIRDSPKEGKLINDDQKIEKRHSLNLSTEKNRLSSIKQQDKDKSQIDESSDEDVKVEENRSFRLSFSKNQDEDKTEKFIDDEDNSLKENRKSLRLSSGKLQEKEKKTDSPNEENNIGDDLITEKRKSLRLSSGKIQEKEKTTDTSNEKDSVDVDLIIEKRKSLRLSSGKLQDNKERTTDSSNEEDNVDADLITEKRKSRRLSSVKIQDKEKTAASSNEEDNDVDLIIEKRKSLRLSSGKIQDKEKTTDSSSEEKNIGDTDKSSEENRRSVKLTKDLTAENQNINSTSGDRDIFSEKNSDNDKSVMEDKEDDDCKLVITENEAILSDEEVEVEIPSDLKTYDSGDEECNSDITLQIVASPGSKDSNTYIDNLEKGSSKENLEEDLEESQALNKSSNKIDILSPIITKMNLKGKRKSYSVSSDLPELDDSSTQKRNLSLTLSSIENIKNSPTKTQVDQVMQVQTDQNSLLSSVLDKTSSSEQDIETLNSSNNSDKENHVDKKEENVTSRVSEVNKISSNTPKSVSKKSDQFSEPMEVDYDSGSDNADKIIMEEKPIQIDNKGNKSFNEDGCENEMFTSPVKRFKRKISVVELCDSFVDELKDEEKESDEENIEKESEKKAEEKGSDKKTEERGSEKKTKEKKRSVVKSPSSKINSKTLPIPKKEESTKILSSEELDTQLEELVKENFSNYNSEDDEKDSHHSNEFINFEVEEGEEDTPSEGSNDIIEEGESIYSSEGEVDDIDEEYDNSFIDDDNEECVDLLSGDEYDLEDEPKVRKSRIINIEDSSSDLDEVFPSEVNESEQKVENTIKESLICKKVSASPAIKVTPIKTHKQDDKDNSKIKTILQNKEEINVSQKLSEKKLPTTPKQPESIKIIEKLDKIVTPSKNKINVLQEITIVPSEEESNKGNSKMVINNEDNLTSLEDIKNSHLEPEHPNKNQPSTSAEINETFTPHNTPSLNNSRRKSSINIQENIDLSDLTQGEITEKISKAVGFFCSSIKEKSGNISLNVSLDFACEDSEDKKEAVENFKSNVSPKRKLSEIINENLEDQKNKKLELLEDEVVVKKDVDRKIAKESSPKVNKFVDVAQVKKKIKLDVKGDKSSKQNKKSKNEQKLIKPIKEAEKLLEIQDEFEVQDVVNVGLKKVANIKKRKAANVSLPNLPKKHKAINYFPTDVLQEINPAPSTSEMSPAKVKKSKKPAKSIKPSIPVNDGWDVEDLPPVKPSKKNRISTPLPKDTLAQFISKDFKNRMIFDPARNKRMDSAKILKNKKK